MRYRGDNALFWMQGTELGALRDNFKYIWNSNEHDGSLFNIDADPTEQYSLWDDPAHRSLGRTLEGLACDYVGDLQTEWGDQTRSTQQTAFLRAAC